jgi:hypothetical protein
VKKAWLKRDFYAATNKDLFDDIGKVVYRLNPDLPAEAELSSGLTASIARLLGDKMLITKAIVAFFFLVSPVLWIGVSMFLTESLFLPEMGHDSYGGFGGCGNTIHNKALPEGELPRSF